MSFLHGFASWLLDDELVGRRDVGRVTDELVAVAKRVAGGAGIEPGSRVLDLGSGTGAVSFAAADLGGHVVAVDIDVTALRRGRALAASLGAPVRHLAADARALPFPGDSFDTSVHRSVLPYMEERERAVREERRILRPGGTVACSESLGAELGLESEDPGVVRVWEGGLRAILEEDADGPALSASTLESLYTDHGFEDVLLAPITLVVTLDSPDSVARALAVDPPRGLSARARWIGAGIPEAFVDEFLARLAAEAERGHPAKLVTSEGLLRARAPG